jgi:hypothetical protein
MSCFWANHRTKDTHVPGETIHHGGVTDVATRGVSSDRRIVGGEHRGL